MLLNLPWMVPLVLVVLVGVLPRTRLTTLSGRQLYDNELPDHGDLITTCIPSFNQSILFDTFLARVYPLPKDPALRNFRH